VQASWACFAGKRDGACLVPLLLVSLLCVGILGLSRRQKARCLLSTPTTVYLCYVQASWVCLTGGRPGACLVPLLLVSLLCAGILGLSRRRKARCLLVCCLLGTPTLLLYMLVNTEFQHPLLDQGIQINKNTNVNLITVENEKVICNSGTGIGERRCNIFWETGYSLSILKS
jgi:hypothetical protein